MGMESVLSDYYPTMAVPTSEVEVELALFSYRVCNKARDLGSVSKNDQKQTRTNNGGLP
jgi:hypothetical protein